MADFTNPVTVREPRNCERYNSADNVITTTQTTTATLSPSPGLKDGWVRVRTKTVDASATTAFTISASDGTTTVTIYPGMTASAAGLSIDYLIPFHLDIAAVTFVIVITLGGATKTLTYDWEIVGSR